MSSTASSVLEASDVEELRKRALEMAQLGENTVFTYYAHYQRARDLIAEADKHEELNELDLTKLKRERAKAFQASAVKWQGLYDDATKLMQEALNLKLSWPAFDERAEVLRARRVELSSTEPPTNREAYAIACKDLNGWWYDALRLKFDGAGMSTAGLPTA